MKTQKERNKALELYISNVPIYRIAKQLHIGKPKIYKWRKEGNWDKLREETIQIQDKKITEKMIKEQTLMGALATERLLRLLIKGEIYSIDNLMKLAKHGLEVVRPKEHVSNLTITKTDNKIIQVNIPKEVKELIDMEKEV